MSDVRHARDYDIAVIGAGMAGASLAAELAPHARVLLVEAEEQPGYHATGRSAAFWEECYGGPDVVPLTLASGPYLREHGMLSARGALYIGRAEDEPAIEAFMRRFADSGVSIERLGRQALERRIPGVRSAWQHAVSEPACADIDVAGLHHHYLARARDGGVDLRCRARLEAAEREGDGWRLSFGRAGEARARRCTPARHPAPAADRRAAADRSGAVRRPPPGARYFGRVLLQARTRQAVA